MQEDKIRTKLPPNLPIEASLERNIKNITQITGGSSDVIIKTAMIAANNVAIVTCEGMADTDTLAQLIYSRLSAVDESLPPEALMERFFKA